MFRPTRIELSLPTTVVVTGAASGIGLEVARLVSAAGSAVGLLDRDQEHLSEAAAGLREAASDPASVLDVEVDVSDEEAVGSAFASVERSLGPVGGLVASAGIEITGPLHEISVASFDRVIATNLRGTFLCARAAISGMLSRDLAGSIVCVSSAFARASAPSVAAYAASKGAIGALVRSIAVDYAKDGIRANALLPGPTDTALMWGQMSRDAVETAREVVSAEVPLARIAHPREVAATALWLLSDQASYVTGSEVVCDGGILAKASVSM
jgi:NAD(P)-dependent dehydrogenase (short-subunit alcohol dehydrogenase family)